MRNFILFMTMSLIAPFAIAGDGEGGAIHGVAGGGVFGRIPVQEGTQTTEGLEAGVQASQQSHGNLETTFGANRTSITLGNNGLGLNATGDFGALKLTNDEKVALAIGSSIGAEVNLDTAKDGRGDEPRLKSRDYFGLDAAILLGLGIPVKECRILAAPTVRGQLGGVGTRGQGVQLGGVAQFGCPSLDIAIDGGRSFKNFRDEEHTVDTANLFATVITDRDSGLNLGVHAGGTVVDGSFETPEVRAGLTLGGSFGAARD